MNIRSTAGLLLAAAFIAGTALAADTDVYQGWVKPGPPPMERFVKPLGLSVDQQKKLRPLFNAAQTKAAQAAKAKSPVTAKDGDALLTDEADFRVRLAEVLTAEQLAQYEKLTAARSADSRTLVPHPAHEHMEATTPALEPSAVPPPPK